jgi:hypothetical protein
MDLFTTQHLHELIRHSQSPCVSVYMPTHRTGPEIREDSLRCKNLLQEAESRLREGGMRSNEAKALLQPCRQLQADGEFWKNQSDGLAVFIAPELSATVRVPSSFEPMAVVGRRFHVKPILPLLEGDGRFYVLAASLNRVRLFRGTRHTVSELTPSTLPANLQDALRVDEYQEYLQYHAHQPAGGTAAGQGDVMYHGQGASGGEVKKKDESAQFFRGLQRALEDYLGTTKAPLVFAGVDYLYPIFRDVSGNGSLVDEPVTGNPDELNAQQLHAKAWKVVEPRFQQEREQALSSYHQQIGTGLASQQIGTIVAGARQGAVASLLVARGKVLWGKVDEETGKVEGHEVAQPEDEDLLDHAAVQTLLNGGTVYTLAAEEMPADNAAAAVFRHPVMQAG